MYVDDVKMIGKNHNLEPMWKRFQKHADLGEPIQFLDRLHLGCTHRERKPNTKLVDKCQNIYRIC